MKKNVVFILIAFAVVTCFAQFGRRIGNPSRARPGLGPRGPAAAQQPDAANSAAEDAIKNAPRGTNGVPALVFDKAPMELVLKAYGDLVQKTIIPAPDLPKAEITLKSLEGQVLEKDEYLEAIEVVLGMNGVVLEPRGEKFLRALAKKTVRTKGIPILIKNKGNLPEQGRVVSQMITFQNILATEAQKALEGFKDPDGLFQVFERTNAILVTDTQENINRMLEIVREIDIASPVQEDVFTVQIKYALAADIKKALETIVTESQKEQPKETVTTKTSGTPGFTRNQPSPVGSRLLNLNNRPGVQPPPESKPNETLMAAVSDADRGMIRGKVLILDDERSNKLIIITSKANMKFFDKVIETLDVETTPDVQIKVFRLKYAECEDVASMLNDLIGNASSSSSQSKNNQNASAANTAGGNRNLTTGAATSAQRPRTKTSSGAINTSKVGELNKDNCKVLADKRINGVVVYARTQDMSTLKKIIDDMDVRLSQVLIETVIIEVTLSDDLKTGMDWVQRGRFRVMGEEPIKDSLGHQMYWTKRTITEGGQTTTTYLREAVPAGYSRTWTSGTATYKDESAGTGYEAMQEVSKIVRDKLFNNGGGGMANGVASAASGYALGGGGGSANAAAFAASNITVLAQEMLGGNGGVNYILKSDKLNLAAVISASKTDNRAKYLASPIVMTVDNKEAIVEATSSKQFLTGWSAQSSSVNGGGMPSPNYSAKDIGIKLKMTPKINPNGTVMLTVEEEYSQVSDKQDMLTPVGATYRTDTVEVPVTRKMTSDIRLENMQTVVLGGLVENYKSNYETGIPLLKDIPWVGRWLFGHVEDHEDRKELLVFLTPYVLDDEESAQYEAFRRKKALSDSRPWEDHGWSASELADPVSKKEKLRRFKDEWARQDEERKTKLAIEKAKIDRAKALEQMDEKERKFWLELHKDELDKEQKEEFEKQMEEQKDLQELAASIRAKKLEKADEKLKAEDAATKGETERERLNKEKEAAAHPEPAPSPTQSESSPGRAGSPLPAAETNIAPSAASNPDSGLLGDLAPAKGN